MANDSIVLINVATGQEIIREMTDQEQAQRKAEIAAWKAEKQARQDIQESAWRTKVSAYEKLGLTPDEIEALAATPKWLLPTKDELA